MDKKYYVYILTNPKNTVLYTGVTSDLKKRIYTHKMKFANGFTSRYFVNKLIYFEISSTPYDAIQREKQIKSWSRKNKLELVDQFNPEWIDLYDSI